MTTYVVKLGGAAATHPVAMRNVATQVAALRAEGTRVVLVHGGGPQLTTLSERLGIGGTFVQGRRVTDAAQIEAAKMAFAGQAGTDLAAALNAAGLPAVSLSGVSAGLVQAKRRAPHPVDYGFVGDVTNVNTLVLTALLDAGLVPLVASLASTADGTVLNVNADTIAARIAAALSADSLFLLTDAGAVYERLGDETTRIPSTTLADLGKVASGASGGMLPKLSAVSVALEAGVERVHIAGFVRPDALATARAGTSGTTITR